MCGQRNRSCGASSRCARQASEGGSCGCGCSCGCGGNGENTAPTATISMADYQPFILVPTTVFDQGDVDCGCGQDW